MKKIMYLIFIISLAIMVAACNNETNNNDDNVPTDDKVDNNLDQITNFEECVAAGNPVMESYPRKCSVNDKTFTENIEQDPDDIKACTREYAPVCGEVQVQCIKAPCDPIKTTFSNRCEAENADAMNIVEGECTDNPEDNLEGACLSFDGMWLEEYQECEGMGQEMCEDLGGTFYECESACRHSTDPNEACIMMCVQVCKFQ